METQNYKIHAWEVMKEFTFINEEELKGAHKANVGTRYYEFSDRPGVAISELGFNGHHRMLMSKVESLVREGYLFPLEIEQENIVRGYN